MKALLSVVAAAALTLVSGPGHQSAFGGPAVLPHEPPPIWLDFMLEEEKLACKLRVIVPCFDAWMHTQRKERMVLADDERQSHVDALSDWFRRHPMILIDDIVVQPGIESFKFVTVSDHGMTIDYIEVSLAFSIKARPRRIKLQWQEWELFPDWPLDGMDALFAWDDEQIAIGLDTEEWAYVWHAPLRKSVRPKMPEPPPPPPRIEVPLLSVACLAGLVFFVALSFILRLPLKVRWGGVVILVVLAAALQGQMRRSVRPFWIREARLPSMEEAQQIFAALQQNTYRAFDHDDEEQVYDVLARSVDGELLERLYGEIFESLVLREDGGAVCKVRKVEILKSRVELPDDPEAREFGVRAKWRVTGRVGHYGHEHLRVTQYVAQYTLRERAEGWRISGVDVLNQRRLEPESLGLQK